MGDVPNSVQSALVNMFKELLEVLTGIPQKGLQDFLQGTGTVQKAGEVRDIEVRRSRSRKGCGRGGSCLRFMGLAQELEEGGTGKRFLQDGTEPGPGI